MILTPDASKYIEGVLRDIGAPITTVTLGGFYTWLENEQGQNLSAFEQNKGNPLGIQTPEAQAAGKAGDVNAAIANTAALLKANYPNIVNAFKTATSVQEIGQAIVASPWNTGKSDGSGYGGLQNFMSGGAQGGTGGSGAGTTMSGTGATQVAPIKDAPPQPTIPVANGQGFTAAEIKAIDTPYTGPDSYRGFDLQDVTPGQIAIVKRGIDTALATPGGVDGILNAIYGSYGSEAWMADIPSVRTLLVAYTMEGGDKAAAVFQNEFENTKWYKTTAPAVRNWQDLAANDPAAAHDAVRQAEARVINLANIRGVQLTPAQVQQIATTAASQSISSLTGVNTYDGNMLSNDVIYSLIDSATTAAQIQQQLAPTATPTTPPGLTNTATTAAAPTALTGTSGGDAQALYNAFQTIARNYYLNLTPQDIAGQVAKALQGDTGQGNFQSGAIAGFTTFAQNQARQMYPGLASAIGTTATTGLDNTPYQSTAWARNMIAQYTGLGSGDNVNLMDPQWSWILSGKPAPSAGSVPGLLTQNPNGNAPGTGNGQIPSADDLQRYLMSTPQFQKTDAAKTMGWQVGASILKAFGYNS